MPLAPFILLLYLGLAAGFLVWLSRTRGHDADGPASRKTLWAWALLLVAPLCYVGTVLMALIAVYGLAGYRSGSSAAVDTAQVLVAALSLLVPTVAGEVLASLAWRESHAVSALVAAVANGVAASLVAAVSYVPLTTQGAEPGWSTAAGVVAGVALLVLGSVLAQPWHHLTGPARVAPG